MKGMPVDLLAIVEGRRDEAVLNAILDESRQRKKLGIREVSVKFLRGSGGVCTKGPEVAQIEKQKREFDKVILLWDHADSPHAACNPAKAQGIVQAELNKRGLKNCSKALTVDPELEIWLWQDKSAIATVLGVNSQQIDRWVEEWRRGLRSKREMADLLSQRKVDLRKDDAWTALTKLPKEALDWIVKRAGKKPDGGLLGEIAHCADLELWQRDKSFRLLCETLRKWFPL